MKGDTDSLREAGRKGGLARAANMTPEQRSEESRRAVKVRWAKERKNKKTKHGKRT